MSKRKIILVVELANLFNKIIIYDKPVVLQLDQNFGH